MSTFTGALEGRLLDDSGSVLSAVAEGSDLIGVTLEEAAIQHIAFGYDIEIVYPIEGTSCVPDGSALVRGAINERNAKLFLDFTVSSDVQELLSNRYYRRPVRADVQQPIYLPTLEEITLIEYDIAWAIRNRESILADWNMYLEASS